MFLNVSLDKVAIGVIDCKGEEHGTVIPGYGVISVYCATGKENKYDQFFFTPSGAQGVTIFVRLSVPIIRSLEH